MTALTVAKPRSVVTMSSREIAALTGKQHKNVKRDIEAMLEELQEDALKFEHIYLDSMNRKQYEYLLDREHVECLLTGYSAALRMKVIRRLRALETEGSNAKSSSGLPEYRRARTLKLSVAAVHELFDMMPHLSPEAKQCAAANIINPVAGFDAIPLPKLQEHYYSAGEVGEILGVSANKVGRLANAHGLKKEEYGMFVMDKSKHSVKQVEAFRYNAAGVDVLRSIVSVGAGA